MRARSLASLALAAATALLAPAAARAQTRPPAITLGFDGGVITRKTQWKDDLFGTLRDYSLGAAPVIGLELTVFPGATVTDGRLSWLGMTGRVEAMVGIDTKRTQHDTSLPTRAGAFSVAVRGRLPLRIGAVWLDAGLASRTFTVGGAGLTVPDFPSVRYIGPRLGLGGDLALPRGFAVSPRAGLARWTGIGEIGSAAWFPRAQAWGADLGLRASWTGPLGLTPYIDLSWSRDLTALRPEVGDTRVAGGLGDDRFSARAGLAMQFPSRRR